MNEVAQVQSGALMSFIERAARDPQFDVAKFGELLKLQREAEHDQARRAFNHAMAQAQAEMAPVVRGAVNRHLGNKYAKLEAIDAAIRPIYTKFGLSVRFGSAPAPDGFVRVTCIVAHAGGYFEENSLDAPLNTAGSGNKAITPTQALGSASTYLRKYLECMVFNVVFEDDDDDDGEATRDRGFEKQRDKTYSSNKHPGPVAVDPKAAKWKDDILVLMAQVQSETALDALRKKISTQYAACHAAWPDMAAEIDAADTAARDRIRQVSGGADGELPDVVVPGERFMEA